MRPHKIFRRTASGLCLQGATGRMDLEVVISISLISAKTDGPRVLIWAGGSIPTNGNPSPVCHPTKGTCISQAEDRAVLAALIFTFRTCRKTANGVSRKTWDRVSI